MRFYTAGDRITSWGGIGAFWGGIWGLLLAPAVFFLPGLGLMAMAGPVVDGLVGALEGAVVAGSVSALGAALTQIGIPKDQVIKYETVLKVDKYVLMVHGSARRRGESPFGAGKLQGVENGARESAASAPPPSGFAGRQH